MSTSIAVALAPGVVPDGRAGVLAQGLVKSLKDRTALTRMEPWRLLEQALEIVATAERRIAEQRDQIAELESLVMTDPLTGVLNRRGFNDQLRRVIAVARRHGDTGVLTYIDLDDFKQINDRHGHGAGDAVLVRVAEVLVQNTRLSDVVGRLGGDEFAVLLTHTGSAEGRYRARGLNSLLGEAHATYKGTWIPLRASFGSAVYDATTDEQTLIGEADAAMYEVKSRKAERFSVAAE